MNIEFHGKDAIVTTEKVGYVYTSASDTIKEFRDNLNQRQNDGLDWANRNYQQFVDGFIIFPHGNYNDLPTTIRDVVYENYIAAGLLEKKTNMLWGQGPRLYKEEVVNGKIQRVWLNEYNDILRWLEDWDHVDYLLKCNIDFNYIQSNYTKVKRNVGARYGLPAKIAELEHISAKECRLAALVGESSSKRPKPTHGVINEWGFDKFSFRYDYEAFPLFDRIDPFQHKESIAYSNLPGFCVDFYSLPPIYGTLEWIRRSTAIPLLLKAWSKHSMNIQYHIESPSLFWEEQETKIMNKCRDVGITYESKMLDEYRSNLFRQITEVLSNVENTGKFWHTIKIYDELGTNIVEAGWTIKPIEQNVKDFIEAQIKISQRADYATAAGIQLHSALGGISESGKSDSGSEQLYAFKNYLNSSVSIPEYIVTKPLNEAIKANFPKFQGVKIGFVHEVTEREQDVTPKDRVANN